MKFVHRSHDVEGTGLHIMYFLVNASPPKTLDVATSNFTCAYFT